MRETSKAHSLRISNGDFALYFRGKGIDIGAGKDPVRPPFAQVRAWDLADGDAQELPGIAENSFDFVYSSHCLEHMRSVETALRTWARVCRPGGCVYVVVPEWTLYEQRHWPSPHNGDHRASFALITAERPGHPHYTLSDLIRIGRGAGLHLVDARLDLERFDYRRHTLQAPLVDQTRQGAQAQMTVIWRKGRSA